MKQFLLLLVLTVACQTIFANIQQANWRWRNDNGTEKTATWLADENQFATISSYGNIRLRVEFYNETSDPKNNLFNLKYSKDKTTWRAITDTTVTAAFVVGTSEFVQNDDSTTRQLVGYAEGQDNTFKKGKVRENSGNFSFEIPAAYITEHEWVLTPTANIEPKTTYYFKVESADAGNVELPELRTAETLPVNLKTFVATAEGKKVRLEWKTASEINNDRFDVERSIDGIKWTVIDRLKGSGTSAAEHKYVSYDNNPSATTNYYRISQYDFDGRVKLSAIKEIKLSANGLSVVSVWPNPTGRQVKFLLNSYTGKSVTAIIFTSTGQVVHQEVLATSAGTNNTYQLKLKQSLKKGNYILRVVGSQLDKSTKIIVQ